MKKMPEVRERRRDQEKGMKRMLAYQKSFERVVLNRKNNHTARRG